MKSSARILIAILAVGQVMTFVSAQKALAQRKQIIRPARMGLRRQAKPGQCHLYIRNAGIVLSFELQLSGQSYQDHGRPLSFCRNGPDSWFCGLCYIFSYGFYY